MKLSTKLTSAFIIVSTFPLLFLSVLLYLYFNSSIESSYLEKSNMAVASFKSFLDDRIAQLENHAYQLTQDKEFLINTLDLPRRQPELKSLLEGEIAGGKYQFAMIRLSETGGIFKAYEGQLADLIEKYRYTPTAAADQSGISGIIKLSSSRQNSIAVISKAPIFYRNEVVGEVMIGDMLVSLIESYRLALSGVSALVLTAEDEVVAASVTDTLARDAMIQAASVKTGQQAWRATVGDIDYFVRQTEIIGLEGRPIARIKYVFDQGEFAADEGRLIWIFALLVSSAVALSLVLGYLYSRSISRPVGEMADAAKKITAGETPERILYFGDDEIADLVSGINRLTDDLKDMEIKLRRSEQVAAWQMFARQTAHEIRNFLMPLTTTAAQLQRSVETQNIDRDRVAEAVRNIQIEVMRMKQLLGAFSDFARLPAPTFKRVAVRQIIDDLKGTFREQLDSERLHLNIAGDSVQISCDPGQIGQVLVNLVSNSFEANASIVEVKSEIEHDRIAFEVIDDGEGIKTASGVDPFTPLYTTKARGSGLGLAICRRIVTDHGGDITYHANPTGGTVFAFYLPLERP